MKKVISAEEKRGLVGYVRQRHHLSERKACQIVGLSRSAYRYQRKRSNDKEIRKRLKELAEKKPRCGFGKLRDYLKNKGTFGITSKYDVFTEKWD